MNLATIWTAEAEQTFEATVNQIEDQWGSASAKKFVQTIKRIIGAISPCWSGFLIKSVRKILKSLFCHPER